MRKTIVRHQSNSGRALLALIAALLCIAEVQSAPVTISIRCDSVMNIGHPLVFGGTGPPDPGDNAAWDRLAAIGVNSMRFNHRGGYADACFSRGMKYVATTDYASGAPTYTGGWSGVPSDWSAYEAAIKQKYLADKGKIYAVEVWNEASGDFFLDLNGSPYEDFAWFKSHMQDLYGADTSKWPDFLKPGTYKNDWTQWHQTLKRPGAYQDIYYHTAKAVRSVDAAVMIGGPACASGGVDMPLYLPFLLSDRRLQRDWINFIVYHEYGGGIYNSYREYPVSDPAAYGRPELKVFVTEWNMSGAVYYEGEKMEPKGIGYCALMLIGFLRRGAFLASHFSMNECSPDAVWCFYQGATLAPKAYVWRLMGQDLRLGAGESKVVYTSQPFLSHGGVNCDRKPVAVVANYPFDPYYINRKTPLTGTVTFTRLGITGPVTIKTWRVTETETALQPHAVFTAQVAGDSVTCPIDSLPLWGVMGVLVDTAMPDAPVGAAAYGPRRADSREKLDAYVTMQRAGIEAVVGSGGLWRIEIVRIDGTVVAMRTLSGTGAFAVAKNLPEGSYLVRIASQKSNVVHRVIVTHRGLYKQ
jgi:hypothetical protein